MSRATVTELRRLAEMRHREPEQARAAAAAALDAAPHDDPVRATAHWVLGLALHELGRPNDAVPHFRIAVTAAVAAGERATGASARASLAISLLALGRTATAHRELTLARADAPSEVRAAVEALWGLFLQRTGRLAEALDVYDQVLPVLRRDGDASGTARMLLNRGTLFAYRGQFRRAAHDLAEAEQLAGDRELWLLAAMAAHNLGFSEGRRNAVSTGLACFDRARAAYRAVGDPPRQVAVLAADHCELLLRAGLARDARLGAEAALDDLERGGAGDSSHETEIRLLLAQALTAEGQAGTAAEQARRAAVGFRAARRPAWAALADYVAVVADISAHEDRVDPPVELLARTRTIVRALESGGWPLEALHARTLLGRVALALDRPGVARRALAPAALARRLGTVDERTAGWHATALLRLAEGDRPGAKRALRRGLAIVEEHRATLTTVELRAGAARRGADLARGGLRLALADGRPREVLRWAERWRAGALRLQPLTVPVDDDLAESMTALHTERAALQEALVEGRPSLPHQQRVSRLESAIRARTLRAGRAATVPASGLDLDDLRSALGPLVLVEYVALEGRLAAVTLRGGRARLHDLGGIDRVRDEIGFLTAGMRRALASRGGERTLRATAAQLDTIVTDPLGLDDGEPLVVVPTGPLHGLPWGVLPRLAGRRIVVAPSADLWLRRRRAHRVPVDGVVALLVGPDLPGAVPEIRALARLYPGARVLSGSDATVSAALGCFARYDLVHIAAHGRFRADSPMFSSLRLADGDLTVLDMEHLTSAPTTVVLPACEAGRAEVLLGDELIGTTTALLGRGVRSVVAPVLPVPDRATAAVMGMLHRRLRAGDTPSAALGGVAAGLDPEDPLRTVAAAFVCLGAAETATG